MTDKDKLKTLFDEWEVPYTEEDDILTIKAGWENERVTGYADFITCFTFDENGGFKQIGIWE